MEDFDKIISEEKPTLVDFYATWCGPCKMQAPIIDEVKHELGDKVNVLKVDVDKNSALSQRYSVRSIPTLIVFVKGEAVWRGYGVHSKEQLVAKLSEFFNLKSDI
ncbi:MAG: thioredoxin [Paramuribaculum sp.]|nr:thioredoxin [Paramuribaculum sp.]